MPQYELSLPPPSVSDEPPHRKLHDLSIKLKVRLGIESSGSASPDERAPRARPPRDNRQIRHGAGKEIKKMEFIWRGWYTVVVYVDTLAGGMSL